MHWSCSSSSQPEELGLLKSPESLQMVFLVLGTGGIFGLYAALVFLVVGLVFRSPVQLNILVWPPEHLSRDSSPRVSTGHAWRWLASSAQHHRDDWPASLLGCLSMGTEQCAVLFSSVVSLVFSNLKLLLRRLRVRLWIRVSN